MGDRFYISQGRTITGERLKEKGLSLTKKGTIKKKPKKEWLADINTALGTEVSGLDKCTIDTLTKLLEAIKNKNEI